jgi:phenylacetate-coenzyme A ligase PaaK-like adenylate-forming protein
MSAFDEVVTAPEIRLADVERHLQMLHSNDRFLGKFWVSRTSGSTGHPGIFLVDRDEWATVIASYARAQKWAGIKATLGRRTRLGVVSSRVPWHQSARVGASVDSPFFPVCRFDATQPLPEIVVGLNEWQPENLVAYASMARVLAEEVMTRRAHVVRTRARSGRATQKDGGSEESGAAFLALSAEWPWVGQERRLERAHAGTV